MFLSRSTIKRQLRTNGVCARESERAIQHLLRLAGEDREKIEALEKALEKARGEISSLRLEGEERERRFSESHRAAVADMESFIKERDERIQQLESEKQELMEEIRQQNERILQQNERILQLEERNRLHDERIRQQDERIRQQDERIHKLSEDNNERMDEMRAEFWVEMDKKMEEKMKDLTGLK